MKSNFKRVKQTQRKKKKKAKSELWDKFDNMVGKSDEESGCYTPIEIKT